MPAETESTFDQLPEALRLALLDCARREHATRRGQSEPAALNLSQISDATAIPITTINRRYHIALLKLRKQAPFLGLDLSDLHPNP